MKSHFFTLGILALGLSSVTQESTLFGQTTVTIDRRITIQPIQVTFGGATANSSLTLFELETDRIWAQAGIDIHFLPAVTFASVNSVYNNTNTNNIAAVAQTGGQSWTPIAFGGTMADSVVRLFFVNQIGGSSGNLGWAQQSRFAPSGSGVTQFNVMAIATSAFTFNSGNGRRDVIAHELGHLLGLDHDTQGAVGMDNLMSSPRNSPNSVTDVFPGGSFDQLTGTIGGTNTGDDSNTPAGGLQIDRARAMNLALPITPFTYTYTAIPEPGTVSLIAGSLVVIGAMIVRRRKKLMSR